MKFFALLLVLVAACSDSKKAAVASGSDDHAPALAPKEQLQATYDQSFHGNAGVPIPDRIKAFLAKVATPAKVEPGKHVWFVRDANASCFEATLEDSGTLEMSKIMDQTRADEACKSH